LTDTEPLILHKDERLDVAIDKAFERPTQDTYDDIIIIDDNSCYIGLVSVKQMIIQQSNYLANIIIQKEMISAKAKELKKTNQIKSEFIANATHDLRSPVNVITVVAELMKLACENNNIEGLKRHLSFLMSGASNLRALINNILDLSKIEAGKIAVLNEIFDIVTMLRELAETTRILIGSKPVNVEVIAHDGPVFINSDPVKVKQILTNLTSNAAKFTEKGRIVLSLGVEGDNLNISVSDTGIGIKEKDLNKLFQPFSQLEYTRSKKYEGTGLGLTITENIVRLLKGRISVSSKFGEGSAFTVHLPMNQSGATSAQTKAQDAFYQIPLHDIKTITLTEHEEKSYGKG
jgi:signal transduction histidine kinase